MFLLLTLIIIDIGIFVNTQSSPVVYTINGPVQGEILTTVNGADYAAFTGIPFGKPPIGNRRFKPPEPVDSWTEIYNATDKVYYCMEYNSTTKSVEGSEDCLYVNVKTPVVNLTDFTGKLKSVLVFIYGGAFLTGRSISSAERPDYFIENDIVYVSISYRSGLFGYLALGLPDATGNAGAKDLVSALQWVQKNIEKFGGNPRRVTIMGASSGAALVGYLVLSNTAEGLFHQAISMSGVPVCPWAFNTPTEAQYKTERLAKLMGMNWTDNESLLRAFHQASAVDIVKATTVIATTFGPFRPTIEDEKIATDPFLTECSLKKYLTGNFNKVPQIIGYANQETVVFANHMNRIQDTINEAVEGVKEAHQKIPKSIESVQQDLINASSNVFKDISYSELRKFINDTSNILYIAGVDQAQQLLAYHNDDKPIYYYHVSDSLPGPHHIARDNNLPGAGHGDELPYIFYDPTTNLSDPVAQRAVKRVSTMWSNFVKHGDPTPEWIDDDVVNFTWPSSGDLGISVDIGYDLTIGGRPITKKAKHWQTIIRPYLNEIYGCV